MRNLYGNTTVERNARLELRLVKKEEERHSTAVQNSYAINRVAEDRSIRSNLWHFDGDPSILNVPHRDLLGDDRLSARTINEEITSLQ